MSSDQLRRLVRAGDVVGVKEFLRGVSDVEATLNETDSDGSTPLYCAVSAESPSAELVELLLDAGADHRFVKSSLFAKERLLSAALRRGCLPVVKSLHSHGADFSYKDKNGYTAMLEAVYGTGDRVELIEFLISLGLELNGVSSYGETAVRSAHLHGNYKLVELLLRSGADERPLAWTPLIRAAAIGSLEDVEAELSQGPNLSAKDTWHATALHVALRRGNIEIVERLLASGAELKETGNVEASSLSYAVSSGNRALVIRLLELGCDIEGKDPMGHTVLTVAAENGDFPMVELLLRQGADPNAPMEYSRVLEYAQDQRTLTTLLDHGANPADFRHDTRRILLGLGEVDPDLLEGVSHEQFQAAKFPIEGRSNPEARNEPFWLAMIRSGVNGYCARERFNLPATFACGIGRTRAPAVWCADRFGQSVTTMADGRVILIAGEHEDSYDPDFCIYNDVIVFGPEGKIQIFLYPYSVFPPTDFHTANLVGDFIWIVGSLGYAEQREGPIPVFRLDTRTYAIERVSTFGVLPPRIHSHRTQYVEGSLLVRGGTAVTFKGRDERHDKNVNAYRLDLESRAWAQIRD